MLLRHALAIVSASVFFGATAVAQPLVERATTPPSLSFWMRKSEFRKDLEITDDQHDELQLIYRERGKFLSTDPAELPPEERRLHLATYMARQAEFQKRADEVLLPHQHRRLAQLRQQVVIDAQGPTAGLTHPKMIEQIKLNQVQIEKVKRTAEATDAKLKEKLEKLAREMEIARSEARRVIFSELTDEQRRLYQDIVGEIAGYSLISAQLIAPGIPVPRVIRFTSLWRKPEFREDLEIVEDQLKELHTIVEERTKYTSGRNLAEMPVEERQAFLSTYSARMAEFEKRAEDVLLPHQKRRLEQLRRQVAIDAQGPTAGLTHPQMAEQLKLTEVQIGKIKAAAEVTNAKLKEKVAKLEAEIKQARDEAQQTVLRELTDEQRRLYRDAVGEIADYNLR